jgi:3-hydroxybutyryl-CoA dehydrogenase
MTLIKNIGIIGAGTMGASIAQICALKGYKTILLDLDQASLNKAKNTIENNLDKGIQRGKISSDDKKTCINNLLFTLQINDLVVDLVIEAVVERLDVKQSLFKKLAKINKASTILASNTSSIPITDIASEIPHPERVVGMHFFNPAHIMKLVEVISGKATDNDIARTIYKLAEHLDKKPVNAKDSPGFIVNRVARHFYLESLKCLEEGVTDHKGIDKLMESIGFKMGPFKLMDLIGIDTNYSVTTSMYESFNKEPRFKPNNIQKEKVDAGHWGKKSGKGFYDYS